MSTRSSSAYSEAPRAEIQPCGFLVALDERWRIAHVSDNVGDHFADCGPRMAGQALAEFFGASAVHALRNQLALLRDPQASGRLFSQFFAGVPKPFDIDLQRTDGFILLEVFPGTHETGDPIGTLRALCERLDRHDGLGEMLREGAHQMRALTGFERVAIFRFAADGEAELVAHEARGNHQPPAPPAEPGSLRMLNDVAAASIALEPEPGGDLLRNCLLRAPGEREIAEAKADGAAASLIVPLRSAGRDWGVALCLNSTPRRPMLDRIAAVELFADLLAMRAELCELRAARPA